LEGHGYGGLIYRKRWQGLYVIHIAQGIGDIQLVQAAYANNIARLCFLNLYTLQARVAHDFKDPALAFLAIGTNRHHRRVGGDSAAGNTADTNHTKKAAVIELGDLHLEGAV